MQSRILYAAVAAVAVACLTPQARAGCVISPDGKSIDVVTDNDADREKNCAVKCQVDTKIGVAQVSCGGNTPPFAKAHSLCDFDKPEPYYKKVISSEDTCKGGAASAPKAPAVAAPARTVTSDPSKPSFSCRISADGKTADAMIANPYKQDASCQVNCQISTTRAGSTFQFSCTKNAAAGAGEVVLCSQTYDKGKLVKMVGGSGSCTNPEVAAAEAEKDDDDAEIEKMMSDPAKLREHIRKQLPPDAQKMMDQMQK